ncbi:MAG: DinB family protein [Thermoplasmata archaeon]|nr:DinB family protein [Thermoplasmata archaeon]
MSKLATVRRLNSYDRLVFDRFVRAVSRLGWAKASEDRGTGHLSLKNTLVHILNVHEAWLVAIAQDRSEVFDVPGRRPTEVGSWREFRIYRDRVWKGVDGWMTTLTEAKLSRRVKAAWMPGTYTLEDAFYQVAFEQAHHLGEVIAVFWQDDRAPPKMTWIENLPVRSRR